MANLSLLGFLGLSLSVGGALALPLFAGCSSGTSGGTGGQGGGGHVGGSHAGGSHAGGAGPDCDAIAKDESATPVPVRFVNETGADLYVQVNDNSNCGPRPFLIKDPDGDELSWTNDGVCTQTCADFSCVCTATCGEAPATRVTPNSAVTIQWKGVVREERTLPTSCIPSGSFCNPGAPCEAEIVPKTFPLTFVGTAWTAADCGGGACTCAPDANGICVIDHSSPSGSAVQATATFAAGGTSIDLVFQGP